LEDILQHDPREKLELFPKLGYYFISFRAVESWGARKSQPPEEVIDALGHGHDGGFVGASNVYLVVFKEGICSVSDLLTHPHLERYFFTIVSLYGYLRYVLIQISASHIDEAA